MWPRALPFSKLRSRLSIGLYILTISGGQKVHARGVIEKSQVEINRFADMDKLETQLRKLEVNLMSVIDFLKARVNPIDMKRQDQRDQVYVDFHLDDEFGKTPAIENDLDQIIERIALLLGKDPADFKSPEKKQKIYQALLDFFRTKAVRGGNEKRDLASVGTNQSLMALAKAFGVSESDLTPQLQANLRVIGEMLTKVQKLLYDSGPYDGSGNRAKGSGPGVATAGGGAGALDPAAQVLGASDTAPKQELFAPEGGDSVAPPKYANQDRAPSPTEGAYSPVGGSSFGPYQPSGGVSSGGDSAPFNSSLRGQPSSGGGGQTAGAPPMDLGHSADAPKALSRNLASGNNNGGGGYDPRDLLGSVPVNSGGNSTNSGKTSTFKPAINRGEQFLGVQPDINDPAAKPILAQERIFIPNPKTDSKAFQALVQKHDDLQALPTRTLAQNRELEQAEESLRRQSKEILDYGKGDWGKVANEQCVEKLKEQYFDHYQKDRHGNLSFYDWMLKCKIQGRNKEDKACDEDGLLRDLDIGSQNIAKRESLSRDTDKSHEDYNLLYCDLHKCSRSMPDAAKNPALADYLNRMTRATALMNGISSTQNPVCGIVGEKLLLHTMGEKCQEFESDDLYKILKKPDYDSDKLKLWVLHRFLHLLSERPIDSSVAKHQTPEDIKKKGQDTDWTKPRESRLAELQSVMLPGADSKETAKKNAAHNYLAFQILDNKGECSKGKSWPRIIRQIEKEMRQIASQCCNSILGKAMSVKFGEGLIPPDPGVAPASKYTVMDVNQGLQELMATKGDKKGYGQFRRPDDNLPPRDGKAVCPSPALESSMSSLGFLMEDRDCEKINDFYDFYLSMVLYPKDPRVKLEGNKSSRH